jgi:ABC-type Zn uptake system ZnuABC Zn-binding protein ZnuA
MPGKKPKSVMKQIVLLLLMLTLAACQPAGRTAQSGEGRTALRVMAAETFLADIAQNVAGDRVKVEALMPMGIDPHTFEPTPADVAKVADSDVLIINGAGLEEFLDKLLQNAGGQHQTIEAAAGLTSRPLREGELTDPDHGGDPHFFLDPNHVITYVDNIRDGLTKADPAGAATYADNAETYIAKLQELDRWIVDRVKEVPEANRLLITNHDNFGYFADRYGFKVIGTVVPSVSSGASPSAQQLAELIDQIKATKARAIFLERGSNPQLAEQVAEETGSVVVTDLYGDSLGDTHTPASTYIDMMKFNTNTIVDALK